MGNHDAMFAADLPHSVAPWMSNGELAHQHWVHAQLNPTLRPVLTTWPQTLKKRVSGAPASTIQGRDFVAVMPHRSLAKFDRLFARHRAWLVFYGHHYLTWRGTRRWSSIETSHNPLPCGPFATTDSHYFARLRSEQCPNGGPSR